MHENAYFLQKLERYNNKFWIITYCTDKRYFTITDIYLHNLKKLFKEAVKHYNLEKIRFGKSSNYIYQRAKLEGFKLRLYNLLNKFRIILLNCESNDRALHFLTIINTITNQLL